MSKKITKTKVLRAKKPTSTKRAVATVSKPKAKKPTIAKKVVTTKNVRSSAYNRGSAYAKEELSNYNAMSKRAKVLMQSADIKAKGVIRQWQKTAPTKLLSSFNFFVNEQQNPNNSSQLKEYSKGYVEHLSRSSTFDKIVKNSSKPKLPTKRKTPITASKKRTVKKQRSDL